MMYVFSTNRVKLVEKKSKTTLKPGQREYASSEQNTCYTIFKAVLKSYLNHGQNANQS
jgi:hypothetical protein